MAVSSRLVQVNEWLAAIGNRSLHLATEEGTEPISRERVLALADRCEWAEIKDDDRLPGVYPKYLVMGYGDFLEYCRSGGTSQTSQAYWLTASAA